MKRLFLACALLLWSLPASAQLIPPPQSVTVQDTGTPCATAGTCAVWQVTNAPTVTFQLVGTCTSCVGTFEATSNGNTWVAVNVVNLATGAIGSTTAAAGQFMVGNTGIVSVRLRATTLGTGGWNITLTRGTATAGGNAGSLTINDGTNIYLVDPCQSVAKTTVAISQTADTKVISAASGKKNYICSIVLVAATAEILDVIEGTGSTCGTNAVALVGSTTDANGLSFAANGGFAAIGGASTAIPGSGTNVDTCLMQSSTARVSGFLSYVQR